MLLWILQFTLTEDACKYGGVVFNTTLLREDITTTEGGGVSIPCPYHLNRNDPLPLMFWQITYVSGEQMLLFPGILPPNYDYDSTSKVLNISNIGLELNNSEVACCFEFFNLAELCEANRTVITVINFFTLDEVTVSIAEDNETIAKADAVTDFVDTQTKSKMLSPKLYLGSLTVIITSSVVYLSIYLIVNDLNWFTMN